MQVKLSASQYRFCAGVSMETALHEFVHREEHCLVGKKPAMGFFLDIVGDSTRLPSMVLFWLCEGWACLRFSPNG